MFFAWPPTAAARTSCVWSKSTPTATPTVAATSRDGTATPVMRAGSARRGRVLRAPESWPGGVPGPATPAAGNPSPTTLPRPLEEHSPNWPSAAVCRCWPREFACPTPPVLPSFLRSEPPDEPRSPGPHAARCCRPRPAGRQAALRVLSAGPQRENTRELDRLAAPVAAWPFSTHRCRCPGRCPGRCPVKRPPRRPAGRPGEELVSAPGAAGHRVPRGGARCSRGTGAPSAARSQAHGVDVAPPRYGRLRTGF